MPTKGRILCVDNQADICELVCTILKDYEIVSVQNKTDGLRKAKGDFFDLYLLAYFLPDGTGVELATLIRDFNDYTPILFIATRSTLTDGNVSDVGAQGSVSPDDLPEDLLRKVSRILNNLGNGYSR